MRRRRSALLRETIREAREGVDLTSPPPPPPSSGVAVAVGSFNSPVRLPKLAFCAIFGILK